MGPRPRRAPCRRGCACTCRMAVQASGFRQRERKRRLGDDRCAPLRQLRRRASCSYCRHQCIDDWYEPLARCNRHPVGQGRRMTSNVGFIDAVPYRQDDFLALGFARSQAIEFLARPLLGEKCGLSTTMPKREHARPLSMLRRRLSPTVSVKLSYQMRRPCPRKASTSGRTKPSLSSEAWLTKACQAAGSPSGLAGDACGEGRSGKWCGGAELRRQVCGNDAVRHGQHGPASFHRKRRRRCFQFARAHALRFGAGYAASGKQCAKQAVALVPHEERAVQYHCDHQQPHGIAHGVAVVLGHAAGRDAVAQQGLLHGLVPISRSIDADRRAPSSALKEGMSPLRTR